MPFRVHTNQPALAAQRVLGQNQERLGKSLSRLSTGSRIVTASDDAAGLAISERLKAQATGSRAALRNAEDAKSFVQAAEGSLNEQNNILLRMRELAIQASSDTVSDTERAFLDEEFQQIHDEMDRIAQSTYYRGQPILKGESQELDIQVGPNGGAENRITMKIDIDATQSGLSTSGLEVSDQDYAQDSLETIDDAITKVTEYRSKLGAYQSRLDKTTNALSVNVENLEEARSRISDADFAEETAAIVKAQILTDSSLAVLSQANHFNGRAVRLIENI
ncbi:MAG: flagellin FliC [Bdellovibrionales bacterium]|nr:flagellin FliC [Bdellovibrionales bacterium]